MKDRWNSWYSQGEYVYGTEPNKFFEEEISRITPGKVLLLAEGEGRNAVFAAKLGWEVNAVDFSAEGKRKAEELATKNNVRLNYILNDLAEYEPEEQLYDAAGIFYVHLEKEIRERLIKSTINSLKHNGILIFECFEKEQLQYNSGGPKKAELLYSLEDAVNDFIDLEFKKLSKEKVQLNEGQKHAGEGIVIQFVGRKHKSPA